MPELRFDSNLPVHTPHPLLYDGQSDASAVESLGRVQPLERAKDPFVILRLDSDAVVVNVYSHQTTPLFRPKFDDRLRPGIDEPDGLSWSGGFAPRQTFS